MDDSGVHLDRDSTQLSRSMSESPDITEGVLAAERCDDSRYEVSCDSSLDLTCWEQAPFWILTPSVNKDNSYRKSSRTSCTSLSTVQLRRRLREDDIGEQSWQAESGYMTISPEPSYSPYLIELQKRDVQDREEVVCNELILIGHLEDLGFVPYEKEIYEHRMKLEALYHPKASLACQPKVTEQIRAMLVEWMTQLHHRLDLKLDTLFLAVNIFDRFLVTTPISTNCMQLLGLTATLVASKMNEIFPPAIQELLDMTDEPYVAFQVKQLERLVLTRLNFNLMAPTAIFFMEHHMLARMRNSCFPASACQTVKQVRLLCRYVLQVSLQYYGLCQFRPSLLAVAAIHKAAEFTNKDVHYVDVDVSQYDAVEFADCLSKLEPIVERLACNYDLEFVLRKYAHIYD